MEGPRGWKKECRGWEEEKYGLTRWMEGLEGMEGLDI
jgi:hypothetical protein